MRRKKVCGRGVQCTESEAIRAVIQAVEELGSPVILQHAEVHENLISLEEIGPIMLHMPKRQVFQLQYI